MDNFVAICKKVRKNLKSQYTEGWMDPGASYEDDDDWDRQEFTPSIVEGWASHATDNILKILLINQL